MGVTASSFSKSGNHMVSEFTGPSQTNWITAHSEACIMTAPEVQRCWQRYVALGADKNGNVPQRSLITDDPFSVKLVQQLPVSGNGLVSFQTYCSAVNWLAKSTVNDKLRAERIIWPCVIRTGSRLTPTAVHFITGLYQTLSRPALNQETLQGVLSTLYPQDPPQDVQRLAGAIMRETDVKKQGFIDETQFISWMHRLPMETLRSLLRFSALPDGMEERPPPRGDLLGEVASEELMDSQFHSIAMEMAKWKRDWRLLANCLGFLEEECRSFEREHKGTETQVLALLQQWRRGAEKPHAAEDLQAALRDSGNTDIKNVVFKLAF